MSNAEFVGDVADLMATRHLRLNVGCGEWPLGHFTNLDSDPASSADILATVPPLPFADASLHEIYAGHFLEHLDYEDGQAFIAECHRVLIPGGALRLVVPDTREIMRRWLTGAIDRVQTDYSTYWPVADLDSLCSLFLYSTVQDSPHRWSYDLGTLRRAVTRRGFEWVGEMDRYTDPRISVGAWYQCGGHFRKPGGG